MPPPPHPLCLGDLGGVCTTKSPHTGSTVSVLASWAHEKQTDEEESPSVCHLPLAPGNTHLGPSCCEATAPPAVLPRHREESPLCRKLSVHCVSKCDCRESKREPRYVLPNYRRVTARGFSSLLSIFQDWPGEVIPLHHFGVVLFFGNAHVAAVVLLGHSRDEVEAHRAHLQTRAAPTSVLPRVDGVVGVDGTGQIERDAHRHRVDRVHGCRWRTRISSGPVHVSDVLKTTETEGKHVGKEKEKSNVFLTMSYLFLTWSKHQCPCHQYSERSH